MQFTLHATHRTPPGASRLVQAMPAWLVKTRRAPARHSRDARVYGHTTTTMPKLSAPSPPPRTTHPPSDLYRLVVPTNRSPTCESSGVSWRSGMATLRGMRVRTTQGRSRCTSCGNAPHSTGEQAARPFVCTPASCLPRTGIANGRNRNNKFSSLCTSPGDQCIHNTCDGALGVDPTRSQCFSRSKMTEMGDYCRVLSNMRYMCTYLQNTSYFFDVPSSGGRVLFLAL